MGIIYCARNKINGKRYIGKTIQPLKARQDKHFSDARNNAYNSIFHAAIRKYGKEVFEWSVIDEHEDNNVLSQLERLYISVYESNDSFWGYNLTEGGEGVPGYKHLEETKEKISKTLQGHPVSEESRKKMSKNNGMKRPEVREKVKKANTGRKQSKEERKKRSQMNKRGLFGFKGGYYAEKKRKNAWRKVWHATIRYNRKKTSLGHFHDPLSCQIVYDFVWHEIYDNI